jgi:hypothetical protein
MFFKEDWSVWHWRHYRGTSFIRKCPPPYDHQRVLGIGRARLGSGFTPKPSLNDEGVQIDPLRS